MVVAMDNDDGRGKEMAGFLIKHHLGQLQSIILSSDPRLHYPLHVDFAELMDDNPSLAHLIFSQPTEYLPLFDESAIWAQKVIFEDFKKMVNASVKTYVHVRINICGSPLECPDSKFIQRWKPETPSPDRHSVLPRRMNELKSDIDIPEDIIMKFNQFWSDFKDTPLKGRNAILRGICPQVFGLFTVKLAGEWMLEAGALVLADGGLCCIDEFDSMREHDRATIHEAMEQQTISVAKAGLVTTLSTRTIVFGATNPKGQYDPDQPLSVNTTLSGPLLSRFDIVLVLLDTKNPQWDAVVSSHILSEAEQRKGNHDEDLNDIWSLTMLRRYIHFVKGYFKPVLTKEAEKVISSYYQLQRRSATQNAAHARLMFRNEVTQLDAITAILCIESSMTTSAIVDSVGNALHSNFTDNPDQECILHIFLSRISLFTVN
ncbi:UNVERIFIED_CONTAM: putative DNA helicase MCM9 [Sesamum radiatum]|uniref:DNA helicase n=1 Tax=Sesamum radiatum TaxID=300843 RepID=A0AAW2MU45_SESRA